MNTSNKNKNSLEQAEKKNQHGGFVPSQMGNVIGSEEEMCEDQGSKTNRRERGQT